MFGAPVDASPTSAGAPGVTALTQGGSGPANLYKLTISQRLFALLSIGPGCAPTALKPYPASWVQSNPEYAGVKFKSSFWGQPGPGLVIAVYPGLSTARFLRIWPHGYAVDPSGLVKIGGFYIGADLGFKVSLVGDMNENSIFVEYETQEMTPRHYYTPVLAIAKAVEKQL
jgi:hypothetical protein